MVSSKPAVTTCISAVPTTCRRNRPEVLGKINGREPKRGINGHRADDHFKGSSWNLRPKRHFLVGEVVHDCAVETGCDEDNVANAVLVDETEQIGPFRRIALVAVFSVAPGSPAMARLSTTNVLVMAKVLPS